MTLRKRPRSGTGSPKVLFGEDKASSRPLISGAARNAVYGPGGAAPAALTAEYLVVAGGGGSGVGGGGAGGYREGTLDIALSTPYAVTVGAGGTANTDPYSLDNAQPGASSTFNLTVSAGGGKGGGHNDPGGNGGSGGGTGSDITSGAGAGNTPATTPAQGFNGGASNRLAYGAGGGGGGATTRGFDATTGSASVGHGGDGGQAKASSITGTTVYYAGGGGGGCNSNTVSATGGGLGGRTTVTAEKGGAGDGTRLVNGAGSNGVANTGGGAGGAEVEGPNGGNGGSGVVIIKVPGTVVAEFSAGVVYNYIPLDDFNVYEITAAGVSDTVTFSQGAVTTVSESLRFNDDDTAYLSRTPASAGDRKTWTWSAWVKRANISTGSQALLGYYGSSTNNHAIYFLASDALYFKLEIGGTNYIVTTTSVFRDSSSWYHIVCVFDSTQAVSSDRVKFFVNGVLQPVTITLAPPLNVDGYINSTVAQYIGDLVGDSLDGYLSDVYFIDGQALDPSRFGKQDADGIWQAISYTGSYGTNGFHLEFSNRKFDGSSASLNNLGLDTSGNGNNWTASGLTTYRDGLGDYVASTTVSGTTYSNRTVTELFNGIAVDNNDNSAPFNCLEFSAQPGSVTFSPAIAATSSIKMWVASYLGGDKTVKINGTNFTFTGTSGANTPATLYTLPVTTLTSIEVDTAGANDTRFYGIVVDDVLLVDQYADVVSNEDSVDDTPSLNYCTMNPLDTGAAHTLSDGNLRVSQVGTNWDTTRSTFALTSGKWYWEIGDILSASYIMVGISKSTQDLAIYPGQDADGYGYYSTNGNLYNNGSTAYGATYGIGDTVGVSFDADIGELIFYKNGVSQGVAVTGLTNDLWFPSIGVHTSAASFNFGQRPFAYTPPTGFQALNSSNLPAPTITDGKAHFQPALYTGNGTTQAIGGLEFSPDFVWVKVRSAAGSHGLWDTVRGAGLKLASDRTDAENNGGTSSTGDLIAFDANGFTLGNNTAPGAASSNLAGYTYVAWNWNAGGSTVANTDGTITSSVRANTDAGISIITYTGSGANDSFGHGLTTKPDLFIVKARTSAPNQDWWVFTDIITGSTNYLKLNTTGGASSGTETWDDSVINVVAAASINYGSVNYVSYAFHSVDGFSKFGTYTGNGSADGPFVYTGFRPAFVMVKPSSRTGRWRIKDTSRDAYNVMEKRLDASSSDAEATGSTEYIDFTSNGFKIRTTEAQFNGSGETNIYMAFAENPFKTSRAR